MRLLRRLINTLSKYIEAWESFSGCEGDLGYFSDIMAAMDQSSGQARLSIEVIKQAFVTLQHRKQELSRLEDLCKNSAQIVSQTPVFRTTFSHIWLLRTQANRPSSNCS
jgi:hypothetical protein